MSQPQFRPFVGPRAHRARREEREAGERGRAWVSPSAYSHGVMRQISGLRTIRAFDRNLYGKEADGAFGIKEVRESRTRRTYGCVFISFSLSRCASPTGTRPPRILTFPPGVRGLPNIHHSISLFLFMSWNNFANLCLTHCDLYVVISSTQGYQNLEKIYRKRKERFLPP